MADAWADDLAHGVDTGLLAWRRADVADLNRLARDRWDQRGRLHGDDVEVAKGRWFAAGDRIVALAPNPAAGIVTSQQLTITDLDEDHIDAIADDGRTVRITGENLDAAGLDLGYALTVHRAQGATYDRAHVLASGGGRELAYVALSRARDHTAVYATADDLDQAVDDLQADWGVDRRQRWIADTPAEVGREPEPATQGPEVAPPSRERTVTERLFAARNHVAELEDDHRALHAGSGRWRNTPAGEAARTLAAARDFLDEARRAAKDPNGRRRDRRTAAKAISEIESAVAEAQRQWDNVGKPVAAEHGVAIRDARQNVARVESELLTARLDRLQHASPEHGLGQDLGISL